VPCYDDIKAIDWDLFTESPDLICGGFPCQPFSVAGKRRGEEDDRYLWPEVVRCLDTLRPTWFLGENVPGLINMALDQVCADLESLGYAVWPVCLPACAVDAPHIRQRIWILGYCDQHRESTLPVDAEASRVPRDMADTSGERLERRGLRGDAEGSTGLRGRTGRDEDAHVYVADASRELPHGSGTRGTRREELADGGARRSDVEMDGEGFRPREWASEPDVGRVAHGVPQRVDRLRALGNAIVPHLAEILGRMILQVHE
jgi:DNA (cytosine-5)-methyltransferase 1